MTEIKIEKKKPILPWLLLILGIIAAIWFLFFRNDEMKPEENVVKTEQTETQNNDAVSDYLMFINSDPDKMGLDHEFTKNALIKLTNAIETKANETKFDVTADISKAKVIADEITKDPMSTDHADKIRNAADILSMTMQNMQKEKFPDLTADANAVKTAAEKIDPKILTLDQKVAVKSFFNKAAELLTKMN